jgi:Protein of unknown function, DUF547
MDARVNAAAYLRPLLFALALWAIPVAVAQAQFDHRHTAWTALLVKHVVLVDAGKASRVDYLRMSQERQALKSYLDSLARVSEPEFRKWSRNEQLAFLINAYNAHMIELVLTRYPNIGSVWDFGRLINHPFRSRFFRLFGREFSLDMLEHETIRAKGVYDEPRIHMAVNCASIGCPMLREEAYVADRLDAQLEEQVARFLSDRSRNRYNSATPALEVSQIFRWYREDFESGHGGIGSREQFFAKYASALADTAASEQAIRTRKVPIRHLDYDWRLNDVKAP